MILSFNELYDVKKSLGLSCTKAMIDVNRFFPQDKYTLLILFQNILQGKDILTLKISTVYSADAFR
jgi:hypothetical protein